MKKILVLIICVIILTGCSTELSCETDDNTTCFQNETEVDSENNEKSTSNFDSENVDNANTFNFGNGGEVAIIIDDDHSIDVWICSESVDECSLAFAYYYSSLSDDGMDGYNTSILCYYGNDLCVLWSKNENGESLTGVNLDGSSTSELPDWIITDIEKFTMSETEQTNILLELQENTLSILQ